MKFTLSLDCDNAAFHAEDPVNDPYITLKKIARILRECAMHVENGSVARQIYDLNGNACGHLSLHEDPNQL